jgi:hypothetical protein
MPYEWASDKRENQRKNYKKRMLDPEYRKARVEYYKEYRKSHPEKISSSVKACASKRQANGKDKAYKTKRRAECPWVRTRESITARIRQGKAGRKRCLSYANVKCLITTAELKELWLRDKGWELQSSSIDRINPDGDYTKDNCRYIELSENRLRNRRWKG